MVVRGGSVRGGKSAALGSREGGKAVAEGAVLEARPAEGQESSSAAVATGPGSAVVLRRCVLQEPRGSTGGEPSHHHAWDASVLVRAGGRGTAADCACAGPVVSTGQGSALLHSGLAFAPGMVETVAALDGGVARELPAAAPGAAGSSVHPAAPGCL